VAGRLDSAIGMKPRVIPVGPDAFSQLVFCMRPARPAAGSLWRMRLIPSRDATQDDPDRGEASARPDEATSVFGARLRAEMNRRMALTPAMLHSIDESGRIVSVSDAWLAKLGYERDEVLGRPSTDFLTASSREYAIREVLPMFFRLGRCENVRYRMLKKGGDEIDVLMSGVLADDPSGRGRVSLAVVTDITALVETRRRLAESEARYRGLVEDQSELVCLSTPNGVLRYVNQAYASHYGRRPEEMVGKNLLNLLPEAERAGVAALLMRVGAARENIGIESQLILPDGASRWFAWTNRALTDAESGITLIHSVGRDIQQRVDAEHLLQVSEARYRFLADHSADMILLIDCNGNHIYASPASRKLLGFEPDEVISLRLQDKIHPEDAKHVLPVLSANPADTLLTYRMRRKDGSYVWVETTGKTVEIDGGERQRLIIVRDMSERKLVEDRLAEANARLKILSGQDGLTGLANRRIFDETLASEHRRAQREDCSLALVMIDVDRFKLFNDRYGHPAGDECLRRIARTIALSIRRPGDVAMRYGGEEFAVVLPNTDEEGATAVAANIHRAVSDLQIEHGDSEWRVATVSVGVAASRPGESGPALDWLLQEADHALYFAKNNGRNCVTPASQARAAEGQSSVAA
jgi:diguanylate cyclase (GGDEF)-like protein/PAS domain S-box-containing protein